VASKLGVKQARCIARDQDGNTRLTKRTARRLDLLARFLAFFNMFLVFCGIVVMVKFNRLIEDTKTQVMGVGAQCNDLVDHEVITIARCVCRMKKQHENRDV
jgi:hypothetical protein